MGSWYVCIGTYLPHLMVSPNNLNFGTVAVGQTNSLNFSVINTGDVSLTGTATLAVAGPFSVTSPSSGGLSVDGGQTQTVTVAFAPSSVGIFNGSVIFTSNGGDSTNGVAGVGLCSYALSSGSASFTTCGGTNTFNVNTTSPCPWTATPSDAWLTILSGDSGVGTGTVTYVVAGNTSSNARTGTVSIAGLTFTVTQSGCTYALSSSSASFPAMGGTNTVNVITTSPCPWTATPSDAWLTILSGVSGAGAGTVTYVVAPNTSSNARTGTVSIAGQTFTVTQAGCTYALSSSGASFPAKGGTNTVNVITTSPCPWTATPNNCVVDDPERWERCKFWHCDVRCCSQRFE